MRVFVCQASPGAPVNLNLLGVFQLPATFWLICVVCVFYYVALFQFVRIGLLFFRRKYELDHESFLEVDLASLSYSMVYMLAGARALDVDGAGARDHRDPQQCPLEGGSGWALRRHNTKYNTIQ